MPSTVHRATLLLLLSNIATCRSLLRSTSTPLLSDELGCSPTLSILLDRERYQVAKDNRQRQQRNWFYFDPVRLATDDNFARFREAELKHGRVAMLAMLEVISIPLLKHFDLVPSAMSESMVRDINSLATSENVLRVLTTCAVLELAVLVQRDPLDMPGDYGTGFLGLRDKGANEESLIVELEHGRLAMVGFVGYIASDYVTNGQPWLEQWALLVQQLIVVESAPLNSLVVGPL